MSEASHQEHGWGSYYVVFNALIFLTVVTVGVSYLDLGGLLSSGIALAHSKMAFIPEVEIGHSANIVLGLIVAVIKASLVIWYFMHQKYEETLNRFALSFCIGLFFLAITAFSFDFLWLGTYVVEGISGAAVAGQ